MGEWRGSGVCFLPHDVGSLVVDVVGDGDGDGDGDGFFLCVFSSPSPRKKDSRIK